MKLAAKVKNYYFSLYSKKKENKENGTEIIEIMTIRMYCTFSILAHQNGAIEWLVQFIKEN